MNQEQLSQTTLASSNEMLLQTANTIIGATQPFPRSESSSILAPSTSSQLGNVANVDTNILQKTLFRVPMDKLFSIPVESLTNKPQLFQLITELRSRYVQHLLRTISSPSLHQLKKQDNEIFCNHVDEIVKETELLVDDMNFEEYLNNSSESSTNSDNISEQRYYTTTGRMQLMNLAMKPQRNTNSSCFAPPTHDVRPTIQYNLDNEEEEEEYNEMENDENDEYNDEETTPEEEFMDDAYPQQDEISAENNTFGNFDFSTQPNFSSSLPTSTTTNPVNISSPKLSSTSTPSNSRRNSYQMDPSKTEEISRQIQNAEPIQNGSLCFNQHHHIVVGKYDRDLLIKENRLKCCAMKKSTITIYAEKKNNRNGKIMKRERKAKNLLRFYRINVDFNVLVGSFLQKQACRQQQQNVSFSAQHKH